MRLDYQPFYLLDLIPTPPIEEPRRKMRWFTRGWPLKSADPLPYRWVTPK